MDQKKSEGIIFVAVAILCSLSLAFAAQTKASFSLPPYTPSFCFGNQNMGNMVVALGPLMWNSENCGKNITVRCNIDEGPKCISSNPIDVTIVEYCKGCRDSIKLSKDAFELLASTDVGVIKVDYVMI